MGNGRDICGHREPVLEMAIGVRPSAVLERSATDE
jgi:hypothetical protein